MIKKKNNLNLLLEKLEKSNRGKIPSEYPAFYNADLFKKSSEYTNNKTDIFTFIYETFLLGFYCLQKKRFREIFKVFYKISRKINKGNPENPEIIKNAFIELGPTFIKIGQFLSSRKDFLDEEYIKALSTLQDSLPPLPFETIKNSLQSEFKKPVESIFKFIEHTPIATASIGQVHKAELLNGISVIIKIQRPDLRSIFYNDLSILRYIAAFFQKYTGVGKDREWVQVIDEVGKTLFEEIDFIQEGKNADRLRKNLKYEERIYIPRIFWQYTSRKIITIEYVPGVKITDLKLLYEKELNPKELAQILVNIYFKQFFEDGFYHADPHPGNIVVKDDGTIVFYDFGMVGRINKDIRSELANVLLCIVKNDTDTLVQSLKKLKLLKQDSDMAPIKNVIENALYDYYKGGKLKEIELNDFQDDIKKIIDEKPFVLPSSFTYALRATGTLEGICRTLDPDFSLIKVAKPYLQKWLKPEIKKFKKSDILMSLMPQENKLFRKVKSYFEVIRDLPEYINNSKEKSIAGQDVETSSQVEIINLKNEEIKTLEKQNHITNSKLKNAYGIISLVTLTFAGLFFIGNTNHIINLIGLGFLAISLVGSIGIIVWFIRNDDVLK